MSYIVRVFLEDRIWNLDLETFDSLTIGSGSQDTITIRELDESQIRITKQKEGRYQISGLFLARIVDGMYTPVSSDVLEDGNLYRVSGGKTLEITIHPRQQKSTSVIHLSNFDRLQIGRNRIKNDIVLSNKRTSSVHCEIIKQEDAYYIRDLNSTNGTYLNNRLIRNPKGEKLYDGDVICLSIYRLYVVGERLYFYNTGEDLQLNVRSVNTPQEEQSDGGVRLPGSSSWQDEPGLLTSSDILAGRSAHSQGLAPSAGNGQPEGEQEKSSRNVSACSSGAGKASSERAPEIDSEYTQVGSEEELAGKLEEARRQKEEIEKEPEIDSEYTQVGSEEELAGKLEEARRQKEEIEKEPEIDSECTQVGSEEELARKLEEARRQFRFDDVTRTGAEEGGQLKARRQKLCSDDSGVIHLARDDRE